MSAVATGRAVVDRARAAEVTFLAAAIAYYALLSVLPALLLAVAVASAVGGAALADRVAAAVDGTLTPAGEEVIQRALTNAAGRAGATVFGVAVLVWSTLRVFRGLDIAFSRVYRSAGPGSLLEQVRDAAVVLGGVGAALVGMVVLGGALAALPLGVAGRLVGLAALLVGLFAVFVPFYYVFPDVPVPVRETVPGAALAAVGWVGLQAAFQVYADLAPSYDLYGVLGGVLLLVTWFYVAASLLLVGAAANVVLAERRGDRQAEMPGDRRFERTMDAEGDAALEEQVAALREELAAVEARLGEEPDRARAGGRDRDGRPPRRRSRARGWGPYLVLLYGTAMTVGAFYLLSGGWAILAMVVVWLSTLGLYAVMVLAGAAMGALDLPGRALEAVRDRRS